MELPDFIQIPSILIRDQELNQLDWLVYGVIYWHTKLKLQKCIASSKLIAGLLNSSAGSIDNSIKRLVNRGYIKSIYDRPKHLRELIPLVSYKKEEPERESISPASEGHPIHRLDGISPTDEHNNINIIREINNKERDVPVATGTAVSANEKRDKTEIYISRFNELFGTKYQVTTGRRSKLQQRLKVYSIEQILQALASLGASAFHRGKNDRSWVADPDFLIRTDEQIDKFLNVNAATPLPTRKFFSDLL